LLNLHPQSGVDKCQENYAEMPARWESIRLPKDDSFRFWRSGVGSNLFSVFLDAEPARSLYWSNYYYDVHLQAHRQQRPLVLSRYGGLGNHRYPIGFSGDTFQAFITLDFEVQMTPMAANVLFGYWSHDIGGFHTGNGTPGDGDPKNMTGSELLLRWLQFGAVAPIDRTHCDHCERRIWLFPHFFYMKHAMILRNALVPYIYTNARRAYETGISLVHPMYYDNPLERSAYSYASQYMFGDDIVAGPVTTVTNSSTHMASKTVWLPSGMWSNWNGTKTYKGPVEVMQEYGVQDIPLFVRSGSVVPLQTYASVVSSFSDPLMWTVFPGALVGKGHVYEDDGDSLGYIDDQYAVTSVEYQTDGSKFEFDIKPSDGSYTGMPQARSHIVQIRGYSGTPKSVMVNDKMIPEGMGTPGWYIAHEYGLDITEGALVVSAGQFPVKAQVTILVQS